MLDELPESIARAKDNSIEMLLRQPQLTTDRLSVFIVEIEPNQDLPIACNRHLFQHAPRSGGPLTSPDTFPVGVILGSWQLIQGVGAGNRAAILAAVIAQMIQCHPIEIAAEILRAGDLPHAQLLERRDGRVLQNVSRHLGIAHPPQDQCTKAGKVAIDCGEVGDGVRYRRSEV